MQNHWNKKYFLRELKRKKKKVKEVNKPVAIAPISGIIEKLYDKPTKV